jgi:peptide/nickel transport system substrate-binding protein
MVTVAGFAMLTTAAACSSTTNTEGSSQQSSTTTTSPPAPGGKFIIGTQGETDGFLPSQSRWAPSALMNARLMLDPLAAFDTEGLPQPYLAESFTPADDFKTWTIKLRPGIEFHNGEKVNADSVKLNLDAVSSSALTGAAFRPVESIEKVDDLTLKMVCTTSWAQMPLVLANQTGFIIAPEQLKGALADKPIGSGPWKLKEWIRGAQLTATRWDKYWQKDAQGNQLPYLEEVETRPLTDPTTRTQALEAGDVNLIHTDNAEQVIRLSQQGGGEGIKVLVDPSQGTENHVLFNNQAGAFANKDLRLAATHALDRTVLVDTLYEGYFDVANGPFTKESVWGEADNFPAYDQAKARQLVQAYKDANGGQAPRVGLTVIASPDYLQLAQWIKQQWDDVGFETEIESIEESQGTLKLVSGDFDGLLFNFWDRPDPDALYHYWYGENVPQGGGIGLNFARYQSDTVDAALDAGRVTNDQPKRVEEYKKVWKDFGENVPILWLYHTKWVIAWQETFHGVGDFTMPNGKKAEAVTWGNLFVTGVWKG